jgi:hypothetical protein
VEVADRGKYTLITIVKSFIVEAAGFHGQNSSFSPATIAKRNYFVQGILIKTGKAHFNQPPD